MASNFVGKRFDRTPAWGASRAPAEGGGQTVDDNKSRIRAFIEENFLFGEEDVSDDTSLLDQGLIDSTSILEIVGYLEEEFGVEVADEELVPDNFDSISALSGFLERKLAAAA
jgi:acyl carrier protein